MRRLGWISLAGAAGLAVALAIPGPAQPEVPVAPVDSFATPSYGPDPLVALGPVVPLTPVEAEPIPPDVATPPSRDPSPSPTRRPRPVVVRGTITPATQTARSCDADGNLSDCPDEVQTTFRREHCPHSYSPSRGWCKTDAEREHDGDDS